jgi:O-antigen ligase
VSASPLEHRVGRWTRLPSHGPEIKGGGARPGTVAGRFTAVFLAIVALSVAIVELMEGLSVSLPLAVAAGLGGLAFLALTLVHPDRAVALALTLMAVVEFEPAPPDAAFALIIAVAVVTGRFRPSRAPVPVTLAIGALLLLNLTSTAAAVDLVVALRFGAITAFLVVLALWLAGWVDSPARSRTVVVTWLVGASLSALAGMAALYLPVDFPGRGILMTADMSRADALFEDPNVFGPFLVPIAVILLEERLRPRLLRSGPAVKGVLFLLLALGVLVSFSRAGWANFVVAIVVMLGVTALRRRGARRALRLLVTLAVAGAVTAVVMLLTGSLSFLQERAQLQTYDSERFGAQRAGVAMAGDWPFGVGPGQFQFHHPVETHSTYVRVLAEQGVLGLAVWLVLAGATLFLAMRNAVRGRDTYGIGSAALLGSWCGLLVNSAVVDTLHWRHLWVVAALIWVADARGRIDDAKAARAAEQRVSDSLPPGRAAGSLALPSGPGAV